MISSLEELSANSWCAPHKTDLIFGTRDECCEGAERESGGDGRRDLVRDWKEKELRRLVREIIPHSVVRLSTVAGERTSALLSDERCCRGTPIFGIYFPRWMNY
ncbi:unnamed protein product [Citrullus colocynthis]|uniref:Uncharacterized protein n=1 Tax=Citrullus colocynthis TaxID=252529 RepID=A0ABP0YQY2_9ROSI